MKAPISLLAFLFASTVVGAELQPVSQSRSLSASAAAYNIPPPPCTSSDSASAEDFGVFDRTVSANCPSASGNAAQHSEIQPGGILARGSASGSGTAMDTAAAGSSSLDVEFTLPEPVDAHIRGTISAFAFQVPNYASAQVEIVGYFLESVTTIPTVTFDQVVSLPAGLHRLRISANGQVIALQGGASASFDVEFALPPPCPADLNSDGSVDLLDLSLLLTHYGMPSGASPDNGDLDGDGDIELDDLAQFLSAFGTTCP